MGLQCRTAAACCTASKPTAPRRRAVRAGVVDLLVRLPRRPAPELGHLGSEHPYEFPLATLAHPGFQLPAQRRILLGQFPSRQGRGLVQGPGLPFQQRQVVDGVEDEIVLLIRAGMPGDDLSSAADHHPVHVALHQHVPVSVGHRHRVIIGAVPHQGYVPLPGWCTTCAPWTQLTYSGTGWGQGAPGKRHPAPSAGRWSRCVPAARRPSAPGTAPPGGHSAPENSPPPV